ncbi:MAG: MlaD family protein [Terrimicrobiaceae bacterium]|nr:MlaD family protein [Terrimicrobiaceae bacterium]
MSAKPRYFQLGLFILVALALLAGGLIIFGGGQMFRPSVRMETYVERSVQGVDVGSPVKFRGVQIGQVSQMSFAFTEYPTDIEAANYIVILMQIDREIFPDMFDRDISPLLNEAIGKGLRVRIEPQGVTGLNYLDLDYVEADRFPAFKPGWTPHSYYVPSAPGQITSALESVNNIMRELEKLNIAGISQNAIELLENLNETVRRAEIEKVSLDIQSFVKRLDQTLTEADIPALSSQMRDFIGELESSNQELRKILQNLEPATRLDASRVRQILNNVAATTKNLEQFSDQLRRKPSLLLWGTPREPEEKREPRRR